MRDLYNLFEKAEGSPQLLGHEDHDRLAGEDPRVVVRRSEEPETINYRTFKPERDGLFCAKIFGPVRTTSATAASTSA